MALNVSTLSKTRVHRRMIKARFSIDKGKSRKYYTGEAKLHALSVSVLAE